MRRSDLVKKLNKVHQEMRPHLLSAGIEADQADAFVSAVADKSDTEVIEYTAWLEELCVDGGAYKEFMGIWGLKKPEWWANMAMLGETDLREHKLLRPLAKKLRSAWRAKHPKPRTKQSAA